ncbi:zinc metallopeptidase 2 MEP2 [Aphelenchoides avenae]|nr:zinc metallopeptidase 2 MEP2 [Aphelenchus avenae]
MPSLNSINIPLAFLQKPFFDKDWPASLNFGAIGATIGHEITHGFDTNGVKWDSIGRLAPWLDDESQKAASCVVDEYDKFCFLAQNVSECLSGNATKAENIADNGGTLAAYRAYLNEAGINGTDPLLLSPLLNQTDQFNQDQLFFLNFAHNWCASVETAESNYDGVHSPPKFRVFGTLQNFAAFKTAFNCSRDSRYAPQAHCNVWS